MLPVVADPTLLPSASGVRMNGFRWTGFAVLISIGSAISWGAQQPTSPPGTETISENVPADELSRDIQEFAELVEDLQSSGTTLEKLGGATRAFEGVPASSSDPSKAKAAGGSVPSAPTGVTIDGGAHVPSLSSLYVWVRGSWSYRSDMFYQSKTYTTQVWVTIGKDAKGERWKVDKIEASFSGVCDSSSKSWLGSSGDGFRYTQKHKGLFAPGQGMCFPSRGSVTYRGCATYKGVRWCGSTKA